MSTSIILQGTLIHTKNEQKISDTFRKRDFVIEVSDGTHSQEILLELHQDRVDLIDPYADGEEIKCSVNIRGKKYEKPLEDPRWFNSLVCWKIERP